MLDVTVYYENMKTSHAMEMVREFMPSYSTQEIHMDDDTMDIVHTELDNKFFFSEFRQRCIDNVKKHVESWGEGKNYDEGEIYFIHRLQLQFDVVGQITWSEYYEVYYDGVEIFNEEPDTDVFGFMKDLYREFDTHEEFEVVNDGYYI